MKKNTAGQVAPGAMMLSRETGAPLTTGVTVFYETGDGIQNAGLGTLRHVANGSWEYLPTQAETNFDYVSFVYVHATGCNVKATVYPATLLADVATLLDLATDILEDTSQTLPSAIGALNIQVLDTKDTILLVVDAILEDTDDLQIAWADGGRLDLLLDAAAAGGGATAVEIANEVQTRTIARVTDLTNLPPTAANELTGIKAKTDLIPGDMDGLSLEHLLKLLAAVLLGRASGLDTATAVFMAADNSKARVTATTDASGNRSAVTLDPS